MTMEQIKPYDIGHKILIAHMLSSKGKRQTKQVSSRSRIRGKHGSAYLPISRALSLFMISLIFIFSGEIMLENRDEWFPFHHEGCS